MVMAHKKCNKLLIVNKQKIVLFLQSLKNKCYIITRFRYANERVAMVTSCTETGLTEIKILTAFTFEARTINRRGLASIASIGQNYSNIAK